MGFNIQGEGGADVRDSCKVGVFDLYLTRYWGLKLATNAVTTVLRVDQVSQSISKPFKYIRPVKLIGYFISRS